MNEKGRCPVIGIAGAIGSGKSTVCAAFARAGCLVSDSDAQAQAVLERLEVAAELVGWWGNRVLDATGRVNRRTVAEIVFADPAQRKRLEALVHPLVAAARALVVARGRELGVPAVVVDTPLLYETGVDAQCDAVVFVDATDAQRLDRVRRSRGWDSAELARREAVQLPASEKRRHARFRVNNTGSPADIDEQVARILRSFQ